jgi:hypothetical protein
MPDVQEFDVIVKRQPDGQWTIHQRQGSSEPLVGGPFELRTDAETRAYKLAEIVGRDVYEEVTPGIRRKL